MCVSCSTTHGVKWLMIFLFACPQVLLTTSVPCYVFTSGNLSTTSLTTVTFRLTHVRNADILSVSANLSDRLLIHMLRTFDLIHWSLVTLPRPSSSLVMTRWMMGRFYLRCLSLIPRNLSSYLSHG
jgi:hypothetical protein